MSQHDGTFHVDMCPDCGAVPFQHPMDPPWYCDHPRDRYVMVECAPTDRLREAIAGARALLAGALEPGAVGRPVREFTRGEMADLEAALAILEEAA